MDDPTFDDAVSDSLTNDVLRIFFGVQVELQAYVTQRNTRVG